MRRNRYCYWSVATGVEAGEMARCVQTARRAGVFRDFHVLADRPIEGAECYEPYECDRAHGLYKLHYLKAGMTRLNFDWFVWVDPATRFLRRPFDILEVTGRAPIHVPLEARIGSLPKGGVWAGTPLDRLGELMVRHGVYNPPYVSGSSFWIVHHDAIDLVYDLSISFFHKAKEAGLALDVDSVLGFAAQMLVADCERHQLSATKDLWGPRSGTDETVPATGWEYRFSPESAPVWMRPAIYTRRTSSGLGYQSFVEKPAGG